VLPHCRSDLLDGFVDDAAGRPIGSDRCAVVEEVLDHALALFGMDYFGMPLDSIEVPFGILESSYL
jgi:hypothetical protein